MEKKAIYYNRLSRKPKQFLKITGLDINRFDILYEKIAPLIEKSEFKRKNRKDRTRKVGGGTQYKRHLKDRLLMVLIYYRTYATQDLLGFIFWLDKSTVSRAFCLISSFLPKIFRMPERRINVDEDELIEIFIDATEQPINRPSNKAERRDTYSGKKKGHRKKVQVTVGRFKNGDRKILSISKSHNGKKHDKKIYDETRLIIPPDKPVYTDKGYQGTNHIMPKKKPKGKQLTDQEKERNKKIASKRCINEHLIGFIKRFRITRDQFRNMRKSHNLIFKNAAGLAGLMLT